MAQVEVKLTESGVRILYKHAQSQIIKEGWICR